MSDAAPLEFTRDSILYLIDGSESMDSSGVLNTVLKLVSASIRDAARQGSAKYDAGVIVYNVECETKNKTLTLLNFREPRIDNLKSLIRYAADPAQRNEKFTPAPSTGDALLNVMRLTKSELNQLHTRSLRRVVLITNDDDPCQNDQEMKNIAINLSSDITESPALIDPLFIDSSKFDLSKFWKSVHYIPPIFSSFGDDLAQVDSKNAFMLEPVAQDTLQTSNKLRIMSKSRRKYVAFRGDVVLGNLRIGIKGYNVIVPHTRRPASKNVVVTVDKQGKEHRKILETSRTQAFQHSGAEVPQESSEGPASELGFSLSSSVNQSDWIVPVERETLNQLHSFNKPSNAEDDIYDYNNLHNFEFFGFVPTAKISHVHDVGFLGHSTLLVPSDERYENSRCAFGALHRSMVRKEVAAVVAEMQPFGDKKSTPTAGLLYAANPERERVFPQEKELRPGPSSGLYYVPLPFSQDIREPPEPTASLADQPEVYGYMGELTKALRGVIHKFRIPTGFDPYRFPHPRTAQFAEVLECHALNIPLPTIKAESTGEDVPLEQPDPTMPRYEKVAKNATKVITDTVTYLEMGNKEAKEYFLETSKSKAHSAVPPAVKRAKNMHTTGDFKINRESIKEAYELDELPSWKVDQILDAFQVYGIPQRRERKAVLVGKLIEIIENQ